MAGGGAWDLRRRSAALAGVNSVFKGKLTFIQVMQSQEAGLLQRTQSWKSILSACKFGWLAPHGLLVFEILASVLR